MTTSVRVSALTLAVALIAGVMIGTLTGGNEAGAAVQHTLRIPASAFRPDNGTSSFFNGGAALWNNEASPKSFTAPVILAGNSATVQSVRMHYYDNGPDAICLDLFRPNMKTPALKTMSTMCSRNAVPTDRSRTGTTINPDTVGPDHGAYLKVTLPVGAGYEFYGVTIVYTSDL